MNKFEKPTEKISRKTRQKSLRLFSVVFICLILFFSACKCPQVDYIGRYALDIIEGKNPYVRTVDNPDWAVKLDEPGLSNLQKVSDDLYRGAQPTKEGIQELKKLGIKTVVNLRSDQSDVDMLKDSGIVYKAIPMSAAEPTIEEVVTFLRIISDSNNAPVFVHCRYGADRTGMMCALYRIFIQGWSKEAAIEEMTKGGFGFHSIWGNLVDFIRALNVNEVRQKAALKENRI
jgi:tyrosine-protein phosphatase SIW14